MTVENEQRTSDNTQLSDEKNERNAKKRKKVSEIQCDHRYRAI